MFLRKTIDDRAIRAVVAMTCFGQVDQLVVQALQFVHLPANVMQPLRGYSLYFLAGAMRGFVKIEQFPTGIDGKSERTGVPHEHQLSNVALTVQAVPFGRLAG